ncbi:MAG: ATP-binding cassette domain-containing protein [bacterium]
MNSDSKFFIEKLECKYENTTVFSAENITIPRGEITVILGPSGSGKSTFIEALGLMNKTMTHDSKVFFYSDKDYKYVEKLDDGSIELNGLWKKNRSKHIQKRDEIRYNGYSFVFQDTYLMPNFSAIENIALTELIKNSKLAKVYHKIINGLVKSLNLQNLFFKNRPSSYSGGERQRMAFGRGIFPDFEVLFGDEPTGNLDPHNAIEVLRYLKENINKNNCALIVTHSVELAVEFADKILVLTPKEKVNSKKRFTVLPEFTFYRGKDWKSGDDLSLREKKKQDEFKRKIDFLITSDYGDLVLGLSNMQKHLIKDELENISGKAITSDSKSEEFKHQEYLLIKYSQKSESLIEKITMYEKHKNEITKLFSKLERIGEDENTEEKKIRKKHLADAGKLVDRIENVEELEQDLDEDKYIEEVAELLSNINRNKVGDKSNKKGTKEKTENKAINIIANLDTVKKKEEIKLEKINDIFKEEAIKLLSDFENDLSNLKDSPEGFSYQKVIDYQSNDVNKSKNLFDLFFATVMSLAKLIEWNQTNEDALIKKVVAEIPDKIIRDEVIELFKEDKESLHIDYEDELIKAKAKAEQENKDKPKKSKVRRLYDSLGIIFYSIFQKPTLWFFKTLIQTELYVVKKFKKSYKKLSFDFLDIFVYNELREFLGRNFPKNFFFVLFIQFLIFYLIGTANGILDFVAKQDKNPFVQVINISSSYDGIESKMNDVYQQIDFKQYGIDAVAYFKQASHYFYPVNEHPDTISNEKFFDKNNFQIIPVSSVQPGDPLKDFLLQNPELNPVGTDFSGSDDYSVIVTRKFLNSLGQKDSVFVIRSINNASGNKCYQPLPIRGLVDQLPGDADMICQDNLWASITQDNSWQMAHGKFNLWIKMDSSLFFREFDPLLTNELKNISETVGISIETEDYYDDIIMDTIKNKFISNIRDINDLFEYSVSASQISIQEAQLLYNEMINSESIQNFMEENDIPLGRIQLSFIKNLSTGMDINYNNANIYVDNFRRIYEFSRKVEELSGLKLDMAKIERIRNYKIVASVTSLLSAFLIIFSLLIIIIMLSNILSNHLNKIKKNIGLLMAFGVNTKIIYQSIMITFVLITLLIGGFLSYLVGTQLQFNQWLFETTTGFVLPNFSGFQISWAYSNETQILKIVTNPTIITVILMLFFNYIRFNYIINKIFKETPGNLIYDKSNKA